MNTPKMIGAMKRRTPGGMTNTRRKSSFTGYENSKLVNRLAEMALNRLTNKGGLRA